MKLLYFLFSLVAVHVYAQNLVLSGGSRSDYQIVISSAPTDAERSAALNFQKLFKEISKINLPIVEDSRRSALKEIIIGKTLRGEINKPFLTSDDISIITSGEKLFLNGGNRKGVIYAVAEFFEKYLGYRYYALDVVKTPAVNQIIIPQINYSYSPPFVYRSQYNMESLDKSYADFHKLNYFFENRLYFAHSFGWLIPAEKYFKTHPEYFALIDGKRNPAQMCFSSSGLLAELINVLKIEMRLSPQNKVWSVSALDSPLVCQCSLCEKKHKSGSGFSESLIPFVNKVAEAFPDKTISTLAYNQSLIPAINSRPLPTVEIMFCFTDVDRKIPIDDPANKEASSFRKALSLWKFQTTNLFVWDYVVNYFHSLSPFPNIYTFKPNLKYFESQGFKKVFEQGIGPQKGEFSELKSYLLSKLLWNPDLDDHLIIKEFCDAYYGPASSKVQQYITLINKSGNVGRFLGVYNSPSDYKTDFLNETKMHSYKSLLNFAIGMVEKNSVYYSRIKKELLAINYAELVTSRDFFNSNKSNSDSASEFATEADKLGIKYLRNGEYTPQKFKEDFLKPK